MSNVRNTRLRSDYQEMCNIRGEYISWESGYGTAPYIEKYMITIKIRTIVNQSPKYKNELNFRLSIPKGYPRAAPEIHCVDIEKPFHPNWYSAGKWCPGNWQFSEGLGDFIIRMMKTLNYEDIITNSSSPANSTAKRWYLDKKHKNLFPITKNLIYPDPSGQQGNKGFKIINQSVSKNRDDSGFRII